MPPVSESRLTIIAIVYDFYTGVRSSAGTAISPNDFAAVNQLVTFLTSVDGTSTETVTISIVNDGRYEENQYFYLYLESPSGGQLGAITRMTITIFDNDLFATVFPPSRDRGKTLIIITNYRGRHCDVTDAIVTVLLYPV